MTSSFLLGVILTFQAPVAPVATQSGPDQAALSNARSNSRDWLYVSHDYSGQRYVEADQITPSNAAQLGPHCGFEVGETGNFQTSPLVYDGVLYLTTIWSTYAIDAATCALRWKHEWTPRAEPLWPNNRGVALKDGLVIRGAPDGYLFAIDLATGQLRWSRQVAITSGGETPTMAPLVFDDLVLIGPAGSENAISGWVGAFRLRDGIPVWRFRTVLDTVARITDRGREREIPIGGGATWTPFSFDAEQAVLYVATTNPSPDFAAELRGGDNLYTNSLVALDVRSGRLLWYDQLVRNDSHDWDLTHAGPLYRAPVNGENRNLVATAGKDGYVRVLDRDTRQRLFETPVTTLKNAAVPVTAEGIHVCPGVLGGVQWNGPAWSPRTNLLYVGAVDWCSRFALHDTVVHVPGQLYLGGEAELDPKTDGEGWSGWLTALDGVTGEIRWRYRSRRPLVAAIAVTSGGVLFTGELTGDFLAFDATSGRVLYRHDTGGPIGGGVVTYVLDGRQYVAVVSGKPSQYWVTGDVAASKIVVYSLGH